MTKPVGRSGDSLRERDLAVLRVLNEDGPALSAGRVWHLACPDEPYRSRRDAGMTRTLDRLDRLGFAVGRYEWGGTGRYWSITERGATRLIHDELTRRGEAANQEAKS